jgi:hypothetical protein
LQTAARCSSSCGASSARRRPLTTRRRQRWRRCATSSRWRVAIAWRTRPAPSSALTRRVPAAPRARCG